MAKEVDANHFEILWSLVTQKQTMIERPRDIASDVGLEKNRTCKTRVEGKNEMQKTKWRWPFDGHLQDSLLIIPCKLTMC